MAGLRVHFVFPAGLVERVDAALTVGQSRGEFVREAVEQALGGCGSNGQLESPSPAPAEQPVESVTAAELETHLRARREAMQLGEARSSVQAKRDVRPVPKAGEK